jgi:hypothetical protein
MFAGVSLDGDLPVMISFPSLSDAIILAFFHEMGISATLTHASNVH